MRKRVVIYGYVTDYFVTDDGNVYSIKNPNKILSATDNRKGYPMVTLHVGDRRRTVSVHRLVADAFVSNPDPKIKNQVNHIDGNKHNNHYSNLEWVSCSENVLHAFKTGLRHPKIGKEHPGAKYMYLVHDICKLHNKGLTQKEIKKKLNIKNPDLVRNVLSGKYWNHISSLYGITKNTINKNCSTTIENNDEYYTIEIH